MMIWSTKPTKAQVEEFMQDTMVTHLGIELKEITDNSFVATMPVDHRTTQPYGILHGGASAALAETLGSVASQYVVERPNEQKVAGIEINVSHIRMVTEGVVTGVATPIKLGRRTHIWNIDITDEREKLVAKARLTVMVLS